MSPLQEVSPLVWLTALQFGLYAAGWVACAWLLRDERGAAVAWAGFNLLNALGLLLSSQRDDQRLWLAYTGSNLLFVASFALLSEGMRRFTRSPPDPGQRVLFLFAAVALAWLGPSAEHAKARVLVAYGLLSLAILRECAIHVRTLYRQFGPASMLMLAPSILVPLMFMLRALQQLGTEVPLEMHRQDLSNVEMMFGYMIGSALFNLGFFALVMFRLVTELRALSHRDALTGLPNRRAFDEELARQWSRFLRGGRPLALLALDVDHFKRINDTHGHPIGDEVLTRLADCLRRAARDGEIVARLGGEEFVVLLVDTPLPQAREAAERLRLAVAAAPLPVSTGPLPVRVSIGVAAARHDDHDGAALLARADAALYDAKNAGRDCVRVERPGPLVAVA